MKIIMAVNQQENILTEKLYTFSLSITSENFIEITQWTCLKHLLKQAF